MTVIATVALLMQSVTHGSPAVTVRRINAPEARQGVAVGAHDLYAVDNARIARYDRRTGRRRALWQGASARFLHLNSCAVIGRDLVCALSNYPATPHTSSVEMFDPRTLAHRRSVPLGRGAGSLTWVDRRDGAWWAMFAHYDARGGEPGRDHRDTRLVRYDDAWRMTASWTLPPSVLSRVAPKSISGGGWGPDGRLYMTGHDRRELYALTLSGAGGVLEHVATHAIDAPGQAIDWDERRPGILYGIDRDAGQMIEMSLPFRSRRPARR